jgi:60 kDa SS-A/Ro ribonucleoprotein
MPDALAAINLRTTPQTEPADERQVRNNAGGHTFTVEPIDRLRRFLVLGTDGGTYYTTERQLTKDNAAVVLDWAKNRTGELVDELVTISTAGRAPRQNATLFALAAACSLGDDAGRKRALAALPAIARTGTHLFLFARYVEQFRGWGRGLRRAVAGWYADRPVDDAAYQAVKYRQREGWSHRDMLRLAHPATRRRIVRRYPAAEWMEHDQDALQTFADRWRDELEAVGRIPVGDPKVTFGAVEDEPDTWVVSVDGRTDEPSRKDLFDWICGRESAKPALPLVAEWFDEVQAMTKVDDWVHALTVCPSLSWEMLPDAALGERAVWEQLVANGMPQTALMRQLPRLTRLGLLQPMSAMTDLVSTQLADAHRLKKARVHPVNVLVAARSYAAGHSARGGSTWQPSAPIIDALDAAFYAAFGAVEPTGMRTLLGLDVSGSMAMSAIGDLPITPREASAALALVTASIEPQKLIMGFTGGFVPLPISPRQRLSDAIWAVSNLPFERTDCSLPMLWAMKNRIPVDTFVIYTDNETWAGQMHPHQALERYRQWSGIDARLAVVGMTATDFTIADPADPGTLDVAGFDSAVPALLSDFSRRAI